MVVVRLIAAVAAAGALAAGVVQAQAPAPIETTTPAGDRILLYPDGRWEYADPGKRAAMPKPAPTAAATPAVATPGATTTAAGACPPGSQGHLFYLGRCVPPGDSDYNRGSLSGKGR